MHSSVEKSMNRYLECFVDNKKITVETLDIIKYLTIFEQCVNDTKVYICLTCDVCKCAKKDVCKCDDDDYYDVKTIKLDVASNCVGILDLEISNKVKLLKKKYIIRAFSFDQQDNEHTILFIDPHNHMLSIECVSPKLEFNIRERVTHKYNTLTVSFDYMSFNRI
jgi:hypothetical protein